MVTMYSEGEGVSIRFSFQVGVGVTYDSFFVKTLDIAPQAYHCVYVA